MSNPWSVEAELSQLAALMERVGDPPPQPGTGQWLNLQSLRARQVALFAERDAQGAARLEVTLGGAPVSGHTVAAAFAGQFLDRLQSLVTSVAQALSEHVTLRAPVRREIADRAALRLTATASGSFRLLLNPPVPQQPTLLPADDALLDRSITALLDVLRAAGDPEDARPVLLDRTLPLGGRARSHLEGLSTLVIGADATARFQHAQPGEKPQRALLDPERGRRIESALSGAREHRETVRMRGRLIGASWRTGTFDLEVSDDHSAVSVIRGSVDPGLRERVGATFDQEVTAILTRHVLTSDAGDETVTHELVGLAE